ncbi:MAG: ethanolamine utilization protein EutJ [Anaerolineaceae bacterium]|nr:ethanolamine utilization protein EutJ [Anaerolineaceae bacterium]
MNPHLTPLLQRTDAVMNSRLAPPADYRGPVHVGVDLGTAYTVLMVLDENNQPIAGAYQFAQVVRDGLVVDFDGAITLVKRLKQNVERQLGFDLVSAASGYPPGVAQVEVRATAHVLNAAGLECTGLVDEPTAANNVLHIPDGAIVDVGGGTTGIAIFTDGREVYTADEPTGGAHFSLVIAGAKDLTFEEAEELKKEPSQQAALFPLIRPVMEKVGAIIRRHIQGYVVNTIYLVGGTASFPRIAEVVQEYTGVTTLIPASPLFVTPLGIAMFNR